MRVALYVRVSTQRQAQQQTVEEQVERLRAHLAAHAAQRSPCCRSQALPKHIA
jgi:DNA invertase Pin-like site-specific DNA recombinase